MERYRLAIELSQLTKNELEQVLYDAFYKKKKNAIMLNNLDFSRFNCDVEISRIKANRITQSNHKANIIKQDTHTAKQIYQCNHEAAMGIWQGEHIADFVIQDKQIANDVIQDSEYEKKDKEEVK